MGVRFAVIGDCHFSEKGNYGTRDCLGAKDRLAELIDALNGEKLDFVFGIGDYGNGDDENEIGIIRDIYRKSINPVYFALGNHDLVKHSQEEVVKILGMPAPFYDFNISDYRFIVINPFEMSRYCSEDSEEFAEYNKYLEKNGYIRFQPWPGIMKDKTWMWIEKVLTDAQENNEQVIIFSHVPADGFKQDPARLPEFRRMFELLDKYSNVRAYIAGHCHRGGISVRKGVLHKTLRSVCDNDAPTACIFEADDMVLNVYGIGAEFDFTHKFEIKNSVISGFAPEGAYVMTNCGEITHVGKNGEFSLTVPCDGMYSLKAVMDGCEDCYIPKIQAPCSGINITFTHNPKKKLYHGSFDGYACMRIMDGDVPVRWFDVAGTEYGSLKFDSDVWFENCDFYWVKDYYAFTAENEVTIEVLPMNKKLSKYGLYKGDLHAHLIHGENYYIGNMMQSAFIARAEGYDWLYMAAAFGNDGFPIDAYSVCRKLSDSEFLYRINEEFPKAKSNHFGNCCIEPVYENIDYTKASSMEAANRFIWNKGGVAVPVHPFFGHMSFRQLCLWILCQPEKMPCIDFFYDDDFPREMAEEYWFALLNRGYMFGCFATSDASFDVGRTPGFNRGSTYLYMENLSENSIKQAILNRRTMVSWDCAQLIFNIDKSISGDIIEADGEKRTLTVKALWRKNRTGILRIIRNGKDIERMCVHFKDDEVEAVFTKSIRENDNSWYAAILETEDGKIRSVASPIYFRNDSFVPPEIIRMNKPIPTELLAECENLTPQELSDPNLIDKFKIKLKALL